MTAVLIDDEELNIELLVNLLTRYCPSVEIVGRAGHVEEALEVIAKTEPDVIFLDIELYNLTCKDVLDNINLDAVQVVIISAFEKYALEMHKYPVVDYLLKPLAITDLISAVNKVSKQIEKMKLQVLSNLQSGLDKYIAIPEKDFMNITSTEEIVRLEASGAYTKIITKSDKCIISSKSLRDYEELLPKQKFIRVHNSHIVNIQFVSKYLRSKNGALELMDGTQIPIAASRKKEVTERIVF